MHVSYCVIFVSFLRGQQRLLWFWNLFVFSIQFVHELHGHNKVMFSIEKRNNILTKWDIRVINTAFFDILASNIGWLLPRTSGQRKGMNISIFTSNEFCDIIKIFTSPQEFHYRTSLLIIKNIGPLRKGMDWKKWKNFDEDLAEGRDTKSQR